MTASRRERSSATPAGRRLTGAERQEFSELIDRCCAGVLSPEQRNRFNRLLVESAEARGLYLECMTVEAELHAGHAVPRTADQACQAACGDAMLPEESGGRGAARSLSWAAIAASLIGVAAGSSLFTASMMETAPPVASVGESAEAKPVADITATRNCRWRGDQVGCGDQVAAGQRLELLQGLAELRFESGVTVLMEGPATLDVDQAGRLSMISGRLFVDSPEDADRLEIRAGRIMLAQRGASCGVLANETGGGEVHVFRGEVRAVVLDKGGEAIQRCSFTGGRGGRLPPAGRALTPILAHDDLFVRSLSPGNGLPEGLLAVESFDYPEGPVSAQNGGFGWAGAWSEIESAPGEAGASTNSIAAHSLAWEGVPPVGARLRQTGQANRVRRVLSTTFRGVFDMAGMVENRDAHRLVGHAGKTIYVAALQRVDRLDDIFYGIELNRGDGNGNRVLCVGNGAEGAGYAVTSNYNRYGVDEAISLGKENTATNLIVIRIDYGEDDEDRALVYRNPVSLVDEYRCRPDAELTGNFAFDRVSFGNFEGAKTHEIDELRIGTSWRAVTGQRSFLQAPLAGVLNQRAAFVHTRTEAIGADPMAPRLVRSLPPRAGFFRDDQTFDGGGAGGLLFH